MAAPVPGGGGGTDVERLRSTPAGIVTSPPSSSGGVHDAEGSEGGDGCAHTGAATDTSIVNDATMLARMINVLPSFIFLPP
jgi:hypothetical protein